MLLEILNFVLYLICGFAVAYFQKSATAQATVARIAELTSIIKTQALDYINVAEQKYSETTKAGHQKFNYVVDRIYSQVPENFKPIFTETRIADIVQAIFDEAERFAMEQLDKKLAK